MAEIVFFSIMGVGLLFLVITFAIGELFEFGGEVAHEVGDFLHDATSFLGGQSDIGHDLGGGADAGLSTPSPFSARMFSVFLTAFGGAGLLAVANGVGVGLSTVIGLVAGLLVSIGTFGLVIMPMARQQGSAHVKVQELKDALGEVTTTIPQSGLGQVTVIAKGARLTLAARSATGKEIPQGTTVRVAEVVAENLVVAPLKE